VAGSFEKCLTVGPNPTLLGAPYGPHTQVALRGLTSTNTDTLVQDQGSTRELEVARYRGWRTWVAEST